MLRVAAGLTAVAASASLVVYAGSKDTPQPTVTTGTHPVGAFVTISVKPDELAAVAKAAAKLQDQVEVVLKRAELEDADDRVVNGLPIVMSGVGFSTRAWEKLVKGNSSLSLPEGFSHHKKRSGKYGDIPDSGGDLLLHVKAPTKSLCYEVTDTFVNSLPQSAVVSVSDGYGFEYRDGRDLSDHLDGTMNAAGDEERANAALVAGGAGSFVIHQTWIHDLPKWRKLPDKRQEEVFGREKPFSTELATLPPESHVARTRDKDGERIMVVRQSMPFGSVGGTRGLLFIAYSSSIAKFDLMLDRMTGNDASDDKGGALADQVMKMSECVASNYYYMPSQEELKKL